MENINEEKENLKKEKENLNEKKENLNKEKEKMPTEKINLPQDIRHLVLSGGGLWGLKTYGALREAMQQKLLDMSKIETIYCTSVGSMIAVVLSMKFDLQIIDDYFIKRPWQQIWSIQMNQILNIYQKRGIYDTTFTREYLSPFFRACDFEVDITMQEFYEKTGIELHIYVTEVNEFECIDISYKTHPEWKVVDAVYASCSLPVIFSPIIEGENCYLDGSLFMNYPLIKCIDSVGIEHKHHILAIFLTSTMNPAVEKMKITDASNFFDYMMILMNRFLQSRLFMNDMTYKIDYELRMSTPEITLDYIDRCLKSCEERRDIIEEGSKRMREWIQERTIL